MMLALKLVYFYFTKALHGFWSSASEWLTGLSSMRDSILSSSSKSNLSVEVLQVIHASPGTIDIPYGRDAFILQHLSFNSSSYLLKPNVYLAFISEDQVYFVETDENENPYDTRKYSFFFEAYKDAAKNLIVMPIPKFLKLAADIGEPKCDITWIFQSGRCGSTALAQALNAADVTVVSEPLPLIRYLFERCYKSKTGLQHLLESDDGQLEQLIISCVNFMFKDFSVGKKVCWKASGGCDYQVLLPLIVKRYPHHKVISVHRDGKSSTNSLYRTIYGLGSIVPAIIQIIRLLPADARKGLTMSLFIATSGMIFEEGKLLQAESNLFVLFYAMWVSNMAAFRKNADNIKHLMTIFHDDFQNDRRGVIRQVFEFVGVEPHKLDAAMTALEEDSQAGTLMSRERSAQGHDWIREQRVVSICESLLEKHHLPAFDKKFRYLNSSMIEIIEQ